MLCFLWLSVKGFASAEHKSAYAMQRSCQRFAIFVLPRGPDGLGSYRSGKFCSVEPQRHDASLFSFEFLLLYEIVERWFSAAPSRATLEVFDPSDGPQELLEGVVVVVQLTAADEF